MNKLNTSSHLKNLIRTTQFILLVCIMTALSACQHKVDHNSNTTDSDTNITWVLNPEYSDISIITTKNNSISEVSSFTDFSGKISADGHLLITIELNSLETNIPIRNQRIHDHLFQTKTYPTADIHTQLKPEDLKFGVHDISFDVDLHGTSVIMNAEFMVFEQDGNKIVTLHKPLIINAETFGLKDGITTLKNLAFLDSINLSVPLNLILSFQPE